VTRNPDPIVRRILVERRAQVRHRRRVEALLAFIATHPDATRGTSSELRRLDDLEGEADALRRAL
jgi:hypothetical protein